MKNIANKALKRILGSGRGWVFTPRDFLDLGSRDAIDKTLSRLCMHGKIQRLSRGLYYYPKTHPKLGVLSPDPIKVAKAIANSKNAKLQSSGAYSANMLGLSDQVPAKLVFLTDGGSKTLKVGNTVIQFKHTSPKNLIGAGTMAGAALQALKYLGKDNITPNVIKKITSKISPKDIDTLKAHRSLVSAWMQSKVDAIIDH